ncbi:MAG TPA: polyprenyl synthetase family protein [Patescibacteria group bacterium]|nr:polyprenyl synthetase family protein [Patescibacteria group bacterium]
MNGSISLEDTRRSVDEYIAALVAKRIAQAAEVGPSYVALWERIEHVIQAGGKRIRPYLTVVGYGQLDERILAVAAAQELIHVAMLVHDDIIDQDFTRHGTHNIGGMYRDSYGAHVDQAQATHYANSAALLAGDALISEAYRAICDSEFGAGIKQSVLEQLHQSVFEVIGGELMDVEAGFVSGEQFDPLQIYRYKTSSYSFVGPLLSGAFCAELSERERRTLEDFATNVGIAFQIQDDLLGVFGDEATTGKSALTDLREGKRTLLVQFHQAAMNESQREHFTAFGSQDSDAAALDQIKTDMVDSGAQAQTGAQVDRYFQAACNSLEQFTPGESRNALEALLGQLQGRAR